MAQVSRSRLDERLLKEGFCESRQKAQALIMAGAVLVDGQVAHKAGQAVADASTVTLRHTPMPFVSRGGVKLAAALRYFSVDVTGLRGIDIGSSTGGFVDCLLQAGAAQVIAVDVGYGQLAQKLRNDPRVTVLERQNARHLTLEQLPYGPNLATCDASFISQTLLLPHLLPLLAPQSPVLTLVKPQFEVEKHNVGEGGVVRDPALHEAAILRCVRMAEKLGCEVRGVVPSPIRGPKGNVEFVLFAVTPARKTDVKEALKEETRS